MEIKTIEFTKSQNHQDFDKFMKNIGFYQR